MIRQEIAVRKRQCHVCDGVINKGEKYIRLSSGYGVVKTNENDNYNTGSNVCSNCIIHIGELSYIKIGSWVKDGVDLIA